MDNIIEDSILDDTDGAYKYPNILAHNLRVIRKFRCMTQGALGVTIGSTASAISKYEHGIHIPTLETIEVLAEGLDVPIEALLSSLDIQPRLLGGCRREVGESVVICGVEFFT